MSYLEASDLKMGNTYHIKNNFAKTREDLWLNNSVLLRIDEEWAMPTMLTFKLENGKEIVIDSDFVSKTSGEHKSQLRYQIIAKS